MLRAVNGAGSLLLRGLGPSGLLITRGLGINLTVIIEIPERPRQLRRHGGSGRRDEGRIENVRCVFVNVKLIDINDRRIDGPGGEIRVCYDRDRFRITGTLPRVSKRITRVGVRFVGNKRNDT